MKIGWFALFTILSCIAANNATAQCVLPHELENGQPADADQVMANYNALLDCINAAAPAGSTNAIQYKSGTGSFGAVGPLTDGQIVIGSTGSAPQAATLTPGTGINIVNGPGSVTISATAAPSKGLFHQVLSATPTSANTGLATWMNESTAVLTESVVGISIDAPTSGSGSNISGRYKASPTPPYKIRALIGATRSSTHYSAVSLGWYDGSNKLHLIGYEINNGGVATIVVNKWNSPTSYNSNNLTSAINGFAQPIWLQIEDNGTNVIFSFSQDGANYLPMYSVAKSSGFLGSGGYSNVIFTSNPQGGRTIATLISWEQL